MTSHSDPAFALAAEVADALVHAIFRELDRTDEQDAEEDAAVARWAEAVASIASADPARMRKALEELGSPTTNDREDR